MIGSKLIEYPITIPRWKVGSEKLFQGTGYRVQGPESRVQGARCGVGGHLAAIGTVLNSRTTSFQKYEAVPGKARGEGS